MWAKKLKWAIAAVAICLVGVILTQSISDSYIVASAADTLYGIERLFQEKVDSDSQYVILEIVPDENAAEIGYLVPGYEPASSVRQPGTGRWVDWKTALSQLAEDSDRISFMNDAYTEMNNFFTSLGIGIDSTENSPVNYEAYAENTAGNGTSLGINGEEKSGYFAPYSGSGKQYNVNFVATISVDEIGFNQTDQFYYTQSAAVEREQILDGTVTDSTRIYTVGENNGLSQFVYAGTWGEIKPAGFYISGGDFYVPAESVSDSDPVYDLPSGMYFTVDFLPYVEGVTLQDYSLYLPHFTESEGGYYTFVEAEGYKKINLSAKTVYYTGGFTNNDWLRRKVMGLSDKEAEKFKIEVVTLTANEFNVLYADNQLMEFDMIYLNNGGDFRDADGNRLYTEYVSGTNDLSQDAMKFLFENITTYGKACIVDGSIIYDHAADIGTVNTNMAYLVAMLSQPDPVVLRTSNRNYDATLANLVTTMFKDTINNAWYMNFATDFVYGIRGNSSNSLFSADFMSPRYYDGSSGAAVSEAFRSVYETIQSENLYREADSTNGNYTKLSTSVSQATAIRHIMNYSNRRSTAAKKSLKVLEIEPCMSGAGYVNGRWDTSSYDLTKAEIIEWAGDANLTQNDIEIERVTTAEFIGRIEDINEQYDLIYIGTDRDHLNLDSNGETVFNDSNMNGLIYFNTGDLRYACIELAGQLKSEYANGNFGTKRGTNGDLLWYYNPYRYDGNDITEEKKDALLDFLNASYPIIVSDELFNSCVTIYKDINYGGKSSSFGPGSYTTADIIKMGSEDNDLSSIRVASGYTVTLYDGDNFTGDSRVLTGDTSWIGNEWNDRVSSMVVSGPKTINTDHLDNSSYLYDFLVEALKKNNLYSRSEITADSQLFSFYLNRPKINFVSGKTSINNGSTPNENGIYELNPSGNGRYLLEYKFTLKNEGAASADTKYKCQLYIDVNGDGKYSNTEEISDLNITHNGKSVTANSLVAGKEYVVSRYLPDGYKGVLPWKLQISQNNNKYVHNSLMGYTKPKGQEKEVIKVLQICRDPISEPAWWGGSGETMFNLEARIGTADQRYNNDIYHVLVYGGQYQGVQYKGITEDFDIDVDFMLISQFKTAYAQNNQILDDYNMLILGFSDAYGDLSGDYSSGEIGSIVKFINSGKSVLFAHDTISYFNFSGVYKDNQYGYRNRWRWSDKNQTDQYNNSYTISKYLRGLVGMDRYGVAGTTDPNAVDYVSDDVLQILKSGYGINNTNSKWQALKDSGKDLAYVCKSNKTQTYGLTQGYTYSIINAKDVVPGPGQKSQFMDYEIGVNGGFRNTYRNLNYGTVYYTDSKTDNGEIPNDYNGEVSNLYVTKVNSGQITQYPYVLADEFVVSNTHGQYYQLDFRADDDDDGQSDLVVWYCLGYRTNSNGRKQNTVYSMSPNDVSNNYYIYNKGNITYTGVGHAGNTTTVEEAKLFINTMIAAYSAGIKDPSITLLETASTDAAAINHIYSYIDAENDNMDVTENNSDVQQVFFTVNDTNFVKGTRAISVNVYYGNPDSNTKITVGEDEVKVTPLNLAIYPVSGGVVDKLHPVDKNNLQSGSLYCVEIDNNLIKNWSNGDFQLYFEAQSAITSYGYTQRTNKVYQTLTFTKLTLFELD